ncbi:MAG: hypothetical protein LBC83_04085 [Oscillospiraceae bacterium]|jgi:hypothetical protein|nr:hypothetical protein [Oscillospiraceae bacterium]
MTKERIRAHVKASFGRVFAEAKARPLRVLWWWIFRAIFVYGLVRHIKTNELEGTGFTDMLQIMAHMTCCFLWEFFQFLPRKHIFRWLPAYTQDVSCVYAVATCGGKIWNLYFKYHWWDSFMHALGGLLIVLAAYELLVALERRDNTELPRVVRVLFPVGLAFFAGTLWEVYEFFFDQITNGNTQDWTFETKPQIFGVLDREEDLLRRERYGLIDTMTDIIMNSAGAILGAVQLRLLPYHHRAGRGAAHKKTV